MDRPVSRKFELVREMGGELIILDPRHDVAHRLTADATAVWRACDGLRDSPALAAHTGLDRPDAERILAELHSLDLLEDSTSHTRRNVLRKALVGGAAVAGASAVTSVLVPTPAEAFTSMPGSQPQGSSSLQSTSTPGSGGQSTGGSPLEKDGAQDTKGIAKDKRGRSKGDVKGVGVTRRRARGVVTGAPGGPAGGGATGSLPSGSLPFTGGDLARTAALGGGLIAAGAVGRSFAGPPPER